MKNKLKLSNLVKLCLLILILILITACSPEEYEEMKANNLLVDEYNEVIESYNKMSVDFTRFARAVDKELEKDKKDSIAKVSKKYDADKEKIVKNIKKIEEKEFRYEEIETVMEAVTPMIEDMYTYLDLIEGIEEIKPKDMKSFREEVREFYLGIVEQSIPVTDKFQEVYQEYIFQSDDE